MRTGCVIHATAAALLLGTLPLVVAHNNVPPGMNMSTVVLPPAPHYTPSPSYFRHGQHGGWIVAHIILMILGWVIVLPISVMLSIARSRFTLPAQVVFHIINGLGVFTSFVYNHATPDLYEHNAHHPIGWVVTSVTIAWTLTSLYAAYSDCESKQTHQAPLSMTTRNLERYDSLQQYSDSAAPRHSHDFGHGTERNSASLFEGSWRQNSSESVYQKPETPSSPLHDQGQATDDEDEEPEKRGFLGHSKVDRFFSRHIARLATPRISTAIRIIQIVIERTLLLLGFVALTTGFVVYGGIARGKEIFSILAHFIKGGIFVWHGLLTLGRWTGAFGEFGWAWNIRPHPPHTSRWKSRVPSAEFTESFLIWLYGASNVFLEHLNNYGGEWSAEDFEHVSITVLFFGGGLLGMLIECTWVRDLMSTTVSLLQKKESEEGQELRFEAADQPNEQQLWSPPQTSTLSFNPLPSLVILILGIAMSSHRQPSIVSTMLHAQWGGLFFAAALARAATYLLLYLRPPTSHFPSRPPTELVTTFCLVAGGALFMVSARDTVWAIESNGLDAMAVFTVTMGLTGLVMAWEVLVFCVKGWALRKGQGAAGGEQVP